MNYHRNGDTTHWEWADFLCWLCSLVSGTQYVFSGGCQECGSGDKCGDVSFYFPMTRWIEIKEEA
jgi:hypothetical protein